MIDFNLIGNVMIAVGITLVLLGVITRIAGESPRSLVVG